MTSKCSKLLLLLLLPASGCYSDGTTGTGQDSSVVDSMFDAKTDDANGPECTPGEAVKCTTLCGTDGSRVCGEDETWGSCATATPEECNDLDDNCDGAIDEGLEAVACACGAAVGTKACVNGVFTACSTGDPNTAETCNNLDDNCNGQVDENVTQPCSTDCGDGVQTCYFGEWGKCDAAEPSPEICDGKDNDCNGQTDDGLGMSTCGLGECEHSFPACVGGVAGTYCDPMEGSVAEICDKKDNDCDGMTDEGFTNCCTPGEMAGCSENKGECEVGVWTCTSIGMWGECSGILPVDEVCDGKDNDCDGETDEGFTNCCVPGEVAECSINKGECEKGVWVCEDNGGGWGECSGILPVDEVCDGKDNDCDGETDEDC